jgi:hypothetical protein
MEHSILRKNFFLGLSALAVCIVLALFAPWVAERLTTPPEAYVYQSGDNHFLVFPDGKTIPLPVMKKFSGFRFSPDGKYLYFIDQTNLYRAEYRKLTGDADHDRALVRHITDQCHSLLFSSKDGRYLFFRDRGGNLHVWDGQSVTFLATDISGVQLEHNRIVYRTGTFSQSLFAIPFGSWDRPVALAEHCTRLLSYDANRIVYLKENGSFYPALYQISGWGRTTELAQKIYAAVERNGRIYYLTAKRTMEHNGLGYSLCDLYCYENGRSQLIASDVVPDMPDVVSDDTCLYYEESYRFFCYRPLAELNDALSRPYYLDPDNGKIVQLSSEAAQLLRDLKHGNSVKIFDFTENALLMSATSLSFGNSSLYAAPISGNSTGAFTEFTIYGYGHGWHSMNDTLYYTDKQADRRETRNLYTYCNGQSVCVLEKVLRGMLYEDGCLLSYKDLNPSDQSYTLQFTDADGHTTTIADHVTKDLRTVSGAVLYISDGMLYRYDGTRSIRLAENASKIWSPHQMTPVQSWGILR